MPISSFRHRRRPRAVNILVVHLLAASLVTACSQSMRVEHDPGLGGRVVRTSGNVIKLNRCLFEHRLSIDAGKLEEADGASFILLVRLSGPVWVRPKSLQVQTDTDVWTLEPPDPSEFAAMCPAESKGARRSLGLKAIADCVFREQYPFPVTEAQLEQLAHARRVTVRIEGTPGHVERRFSHENIAKFREFVVAHLPASDSLPSLPEGQ